MRLTSILTAFLCAFAMFADDQPPKMSPEARMVGEMHET